MKRQISILACLILVVVMVCSLASCDLFNKVFPKPEDEHTHSYENGVCGECGEADPNYVPPHTHNFVDGKCECGEEDPNYVPHEHNFVDGKCECGAEDPNYVPECAEHAYSVEVTKEATCTEAGSKTLTCTVCSHVETSEIAPLGHDEKTVEGTAPTCTEKGLLDGKVCSVCEAVLVEQQEINAKGHTMVEGKCSVCGLVDPDYNGPKTYVFDAQTLAEFAASANNLGKILEGGFDDFFTFFMSDKTKVESGKKVSFNDGYSVSDGLRLNLNGSTAIQTTPEGATEPINKNALMFSIPEGHTATVKVWWTCGGDGREVAIFDKDGNMIAASVHNDPFAENEGTGSAKNAVYIDTLSIDADGVYYLGTDNETNAVKGGGNIWWKVEVTLIPAEEAPKNELKVTTTDTYGFFDLYSFTADAEGYYTFNVPAGLGFYTKAKYDIMADAEVGFYDNENGATAVVGIKAGETLQFYVGALTKADWVITWTFEAGEVTEEVIECNHWWFPAMGHEQMVLPTCQTGGVLVSECFNCGETKIEEVGPDTVDGHDYVLDQTTYVETTCQVDGYKKETCSLCGDVKETTFDHEIYGMHDNVLDEESFKEPTCQDAGYSKYTCSVCGKVTEETSEPDAWYHNDVYTSAGSIAVCSICDRVQLSVYVEATETSYGIQFGMNYGTGALWFAATNADNSAFEMYGYTVTLADGVYTVTLDNMNAYETSAYGLLNATITVKPACGGVDVTITPAEGDAVSFKTYEGEGTHSYFYACDKVCQVCFEESNPDAAHTIVHVEAKAGTDCKTYDGNVEYWYCSDCGSAWTDEALTQVTNRMNVVVAGGHVYTNACDKACAVCYEVTRESAEHTIVHVDAVAAACYENGNVEYWYCSDCGATWADEALTKVTNQMSVVVPMAHAEATHVEAKDATCTANGNIEYWICEPCGQVWLDEACTLNSNVLSVVLPMGHDDKDANLQCDACSLYLLPEVGTAFHLSLYQKNLGKTLYFVGAMDGYYYKTSEKLCDATDLYLEEAEGGYYIYFMSGETKNYLYIQVSGTYTNVKYGSTKDVWEFDEVLGVFVNDVNGTDYYIGTYKTFNTISASKLSYIAGTNASTIGVSNFPTRIVVDNHTCSYSEATCSKLPTCSVCQATTGELLDHIYGEEGVVTAPTCTAAGYTTYTCSVCGGTKKDAGEAALGHSYGEGVATAPTCTEAGYTTYTCSVCGGTKKEDGEAATGHTYVNGICSACGAEEPTGDEPVITETTVKFDYVAQNYANQTAISTVKADDVITITPASGGNSNAPKYYTSGSAVRFYSKNSLTISAADGYKITSITVYSGNNSSYTITSANGVFTNASATGLGTTTVTITPVDGTADVVITFNPNVTSGNFRIASVTVVYENVA